VPAENKNSNQTLTSKFGLDSFVLFKQKKWRYFLFCHVTWGGFANN
jgi:NHS family xanthosine MFS transporter